MGGGLLSGKESWSAETGRQFSEWRQTAGMDESRRGRLTGDRSAGWGLLLPPIIRSSAGDGDTL